MSNYESDTASLEPLQESIEITLNGDRKRVPKGASLADLLAFLGIPADRVAVELDRKIVRKSDWKNCRIEPEAEVEVVHFVGGG